MAPQGALGRSNFYCGPQGEWIWSALHDLLFPHAAVTPPTTYPAKLDGHAGGYDVRKPAFHEVPAAVPTYVALDGASSASVTGSSLLPVLTGSAVSAVGFDAIRAPLGGSVALAGGFETVCTSDDGLLALSGNSAVGFEAI